MNWKQAIPDGEDMIVSVTESELSELIKTGDVVHAVLGGGVYLNSSGPKVVERLAELRGISPTPIQ